MPLLQSEQMLFDAAPGVSAALALAEVNRYDAIVLDLRQANCEAASAIQAIRSRDSVAPILTIDGCTSVADRIRVLEAGADDCLTDPFSPQELMARLRVLLRRVAMLSPRLRVADLVLDGARRQITRQGKRIVLTPKEFAVLECLMKNAGQPVSRTSIIEHVWNRASDGLTNIVDVYINYLRTKIDRDFEPKLIRTIYGVGYLLAEPERKTAAA
jgi:DNA-binding response OmpR family regulator